MINQLNTLIIEDHPFIIEGYKRVLDHISSNDGNLDFKIRTAKNCEEGNAEIEYAVHHHIMDLVFLDISLPPSKDRKLISGDDLGIKLKSLFPKVKIIIATHLENNYRLVNILKTIKPDALLLKNDLDFKILTEGVLNVINDVPFYSKPILKLVRQHISNDFNLDNIDRQMLYHLSLGAKTKELPEIVHLSQAGIERRKRRLNQIFNNDKKSDKVLLRLAREKGFL
ncbi:DNA-binding response regulator, NarL/FixJ family, contains REC and HTH domains [Flaviramulus basaltis]|uniref:DNA-binding response regulator, NarL/FixJ family, contains REC and HTH domains n=1 Tax=Flaviramulus basaltis TaxID=369401 RepID=A0A1K2IM61_9FLAO|nr:response regulator transcription factor [Flaviramulus basaltis]SFZ93390.1 DNA-binding response regulator, NarL/FixJ family, contains REC and HTH domains [Flaviramulus basaltis]